jgi:hypothetical protein
MSKIFKTHLLFVFCMSHTLGMRQCAFLSSDGDFASADLVVVQ